MREPAVGVLGHERRELSEELDVVGEQLAEIRTLHFDDDRPAVSQLRRVHLAETRGAERLVGEVGEELTDSRAELALDDLLDLARGDWVDVVLELFQLLDVRRRQEIGPHGQHLPELDVRRSELDQSFPKRQCLLWRAAVGVGRLRLVPSPCKPCCFAKSARPYRVNNPTVAARRGR